MSLKKINTVLAAAFILWFGAEFILSPETTAPGFGLPSWPSGDGDGFLIIKGIRDVVLALVLGILLVTATAGRWAGCCWWRPSPRTATWPPCWPTTAPWPPRSASTA
nr:DUF4267 domain-containing protein [Streptomyces fodineus]